MKLKRKELLLKGYKVDKFIESLISNKKGENKKNESEENNTKLRRDSLPATSSNGFEEITVNVDKKIKFKQKLLEEKRYQIKKNRLMRTKDVFENKSLIKLIRTKPQIKIIKSLNRRLPWSNFRSPIEFENM